VGTQIGDELAALRFALTRLAKRGASTTSRAAAHSAANAALTHLDRLLLAPIAIETGSVVLVPPADLHQLPWALLPSLRGRSVTVAPSARLWLQRRGPAQRPRRGVVVAHGPDLPGAAAESRQVAGIYEDPVRLTARTSTIEDVLAALDGAQLAHLVAHGSFRSDNPLFSALRLADGDLTVYDLERVDRLPPIVVLSACNSGLQAVRPGNETMGLVAALLGAGCRAVIASTGLVPDTARTARTMVDFHRRLAAGASPAAALAAAQVAAVERAGPAAAPFVCFGAG
jgi:CHAT domain-containing protein